MWQHPFESIAVRNEQGQYHNDTNLKSVEKEHKTDRAISSEIQLH